MFDKEKLQAMIAADLGINSLTEKGQEEVLEKLGEALMKRVFISIMEKLSEEKRAEFEQLAGEKDSQKVQAWLGAEIPDFQSFAQAEIQRGLEEFRNFQQEATRS